MIVFYVRHVTSIWDNLPSWISALSSFVLAFTAVITYWKKLRRVYIINTSITPVPKYKYYMNIELINRSVLRTSLEFKGIYLYESDAKVIKHSNHVMTRIAKNGKIEKGKDTSIPELRFFTFVSTWSKEYLLDTHLVDRKLIQECAGGQLKVIYKYYLKLNDVPGYHDDIVSLKTALKKCDII